MIRWLNRVSQILGRESEGASHHVFVTAHGTEVENCPSSRHHFSMENGSYQRLTGTLIWRADGFHLLADNGMCWKLGLLRKAETLVGSTVLVDGIKSGTEAIEVSWIEDLALA